jgi:hypothetical protein
MLLPPLNLQDLTMLLAVNAILLLLTSEFLPYLSGEKTLVSEMKKLRNLAIVLGIFFLVTIATRVFGVIFNF